MRQTVSDISQMLAVRAEDIARRLLPGGHKKGHEWCAGSTDGEHGQSLKVHLSGSKAGVFCDFATGEGGDLLDLWASTQNLRLNEALKQAKEYLGISSPRFLPERQKSYKEPLKPQVAAPKEGSAVFSYLTLERKLSPDTIRAFKIGEIVDEKGAIIVFPYFRGDKLINIKYLRLDRSDGKKVSWFSPGCELLLWGWHTLQNTGREILICEGEFDAMTWWQYGVPALSVPNGAQGLTWVENEFEELEVFSTLHISFDMDKAGAEGAVQLSERLGSYRCRLVELPYKDANECLQEDITKEEMRSNVAVASSPDPAELKSAGLYTDSLIEAFYPTAPEKGFTPSWLMLNGAIRFRPCELTVWTGFNSHGKTTLLSQIILDGMKAGEKSCVASLESKPEQFLERMTRQATGLRLPHEELIKRTTEWYAGKLWLFDFQGVVDSERLLKVWEYARRRYGVTQFVVDSLMRCNIDEEDFEAQKKFTNSLVAFAADHYSHVHLVAHSRKQQNDSEIPGRLDVKGSGTITDLAHNVISVWKNKEKLNNLTDFVPARGKKKSESVISDGVLFCDKQRNGEWEGYFKLWFDRESLQFVQSEYERPLVYVSNFRGEYAESD